MLGRTVTVAPGGETDIGDRFFRQERVGRYGERFVCFKFRSMYVDAEERKQELLQELEA